MYKAKDDLKFIVAEISKNWAPNEPAGDILAFRFEQVINTNDARGYTLKDWKAYVAVSDGNVNETIIAIFEKT